MAKAHKAKVNLDSIAQAHGALPASQSISQILGYDSGYAEATLEEYDAKINALTDTDLHEHAVEVGIVPTSNIVLLKDKLQRQFIAAKNKFVYKTNPDTMSQKDKNFIKTFMKGAV